ncbi:MAG: PD-(D/E)XK nuclease family protein, partial [Solirubrobacteraceae bacterium]
MPLELVLGPANSAKAGAVLGAYGALAPRGAVLVVPTAVDARHYERELAAAGVVLGSVLTFSGLVREIAGRAQYSGRRLSDLQRDRVLRDVLGHVRLDALASVAAAPGFRVAAGELIAELQRQLVTPQRFLAALRTWAAQDERRQAYALDVGRIYQAYASELDRLGRVDRELYTWRALDALRAEPSRWGRDQVFFYGFDDLTALERDAVETLSRIAGAHVTVSLTYEASRVALLARAEAVQELAPLAERALELPALDEHYAPASRAPLHHLERNLFEPDAERIDPGPAVGLLEAGGELSEAELVAAHVLALLRDGVPAEEIAVIYRSLGRSAPLLERVFEQYGIPLAGAYETRFSYTALGRALIGAARCALLDERQARAEDLLCYLRAPGVLERPEVADGLEAQLRRDGLLSAAAARERLGWSLSELDTLRAAADPGPELCRLARRLFAAPHRATAHMLARAEELDARALATLTRALDELTELGQRLSGAELVELLDELSVPAAPGGLPDGVLLAEPLEVRARRFRAVFVCGLQEGEFPLPARAEPFLSDERRRELAVCSGLRLRLHEDVLDRERYLLYASVSRATERVLLSYRSSDEEGNVALPSPFIADVAELFTDDWAARRARRLLADVVWNAAEAPTARELARSQAAAQAPPAGEEGQPRRKLGELALGRLRHTEILSAGALETYGECPVKWLVEKELRPEPLEPEPEPMARGSLMHEALERLLTELDGPVTPASLPLAREILDRLLAELAGGLGAKLGAGRPDVVRAGALRAIEADLRRYLAHEAASGGEWRPFELELRFGFTDDQPSLPPLELGQGDERMLVRGAIDRVDVDEHGQALVRDYKSGAIRPEHASARWSIDQRLQVALYLVVVRELTRLRPVAGFYQPLRGEDLRARGMFVDGIDVGAATLGTDARNPGEFAAELDDAAARAVALGTALRGGELTPCPLTCSREGCA